MSEEKKANEAVQNEELDDSELESVAGGLRSIYFGGSKNFDENTGRYKGDTDIGGIEKMPMVRR
jgi:hypothetical protein